ncbi:intracellular hyaluronan-binding protein 4 isoform X2 [Spea bombifrons]|uniref:intracellular hyaluronan-binding protein 4 isoform X2 n=1 Tax=Spea bombifrons TaxID=233779 RepID=UPI00234ACE54|nr:intracellular hyaluronan-binding protein 4 isoform X2 [Spea bombifrons]
MKPTQTSPVSATMAEAFGCAVENRFCQLLDDETDPLDFLQKAAEEKARRKKKDEAVAAKKSGPKKESQKERKAIAALATEAPTTQPGQKNAQKPVHKGPQNENKLADVKTEKRTAFREFRSNIMDRPNEYSIEKPLDLGEKEKLVRNWISRGGMRGRGRGGFSRNNEGENQRGKREFERHSGSDRAGVRAEDKRGGNGSHNWGSFKDACSDVEPTPVEEPLENQEPTEEEQDVKMADEGADEFTKEMSLDEWKLMQDQRRAKIDFNLRKPESSVPSKAVVIHKSKFNNNLNENEEDYHYAFRKPVNDITTQLDINFGSLSRPGRGGRGGGRGRVRKEEPFPHAVVHVDVAAAPNPDDPEDFPALA